ncbi:hypothetical protein BKA66DRAFT_241867 [Pyrenochaeta sp. MPI-SDFR-AT-0127]|nr:hypothetical protein BKA66DRAFT_241867 [Pyrenochaeta sp. MPI-SDFR-AT-0127]
MAPASSTSTGSGAPTSLPLNPQPTLSSGFAGEEFSNNLFSDLAPLLTLFGEQVTKQFLSMALGWADNILLAMGPLGVITAVVSAIRIGGVRFMKALVGRARENQATAEVELLSSTSENVSELWNGREIVRQLGHAPTKELIVYSGDTPNDEIRIATLHEACRQKVLNEVLREVRLVGTSEQPRFTSQHLSAQPPNIALNIDKAAPSDQEVWTLAVLGVALQAVALVIPAIMTYHWKEKKGNSTVQRYAYPVFLLGSCALFIGMALCSRIIETRTMEQTFRPPKPNTIKTIFRLQMACTMGDQDFAPFVILNSADNKCIRTSRSLQKATFEKRTKTETYLYKARTVIAVFLALSGFICQFVGLRALHWSATIIQLGVTVIMTGLRSYVRRGISRKPKALELRRSDPDWIALSVGAACLFGWPTNERVWPEHSCPSLDICTGGYGFDIGPQEMSDNSSIKEIRFFCTPGGAPTRFTRKGRETHTIVWTTTNNAVHIRPCNLWESARMEERSDPSTITTADPRITLRDMLHPFSKTEDPGLVQLADSLMQAMKRTIELMHQFSNEKYLETSSDVGRTRFSWTHLVDNNFVDHTGYFSRLQLFWSTEYLLRDEDKRLHAILALWIHSLYLRDTTILLNIERMKQGTTGIARARFQKRTSYMRFIARGSPRYKGRDMMELDRWIGKDLRLQSLHTSQFDSHNPWNSPSPRWPIFGVSLEHMENYTPATNKHGTLSDQYVAVDLPYTLPTQCALEIFSGFMTAVAKETTHLHKLELDVSQPDDRMSTRHCHGFLRAVSQVLVEVGIVNDIRDANTVVIPPFARKGLLRPQKSLPKQPHDVPESVPTDPLTDQGGLT